MPLSLKIISSPDGEPITEWSKTFPETGGSVGRSYGNTMQLSDVSISLSGTHAIINQSSRGYQIMDVSTNGLFINGNHKPLGNNNSAALNDGDVLNLGPYRLMVSCFVPDKATARVPASQASVSLGDWDEDPFGSDLPANNRRAQQPDDFHEAEIELSFSAVDDSVEADPFSALEPESTRQSSTTQMNSFDDDCFDDDPFSADNANPLKNSAPPLKNTVQPVRPQHEMSISPVAESEQINMISAQQEEAMLQAAEIAFVRIMEEMEPSHIEGLFNDLIRPAFFSRKPDYWSMYKRYFQRQQSTQDWQLKFKAYFFSESTRIRQLRGEK
jgi:predicted component of type VI protein secretion system